MVWNICWTFSARHLASDLLPTKGRKNLPAKITRQNCPGSGFCYGSAFYIFSVTLFSCYENSNTNCGNEGSLFELLGGERGNGHTRSVCLSVFICRGGRERTRTFQGLRRCLEDVSKHVRHLRGHDLLTSSQRVLCLGHAQNGAARAKC